MKEFSINEPVTPDQLIDLDTLTKILQNPMPIRDHIIAATMYCYAKRADEAEKMAKSYAEANQILEARCKALEGVLKGTASYIASFSRDDLNDAWEHGNVRHAIDKVLGR